MLAKLSPDQIIKMVWEKYNKFQVNQEIGRPPLYTGLFINRLPYGIKNEILTSALPIIQFGIGTAQEITQYFPSDKIIGYDFSETAVKELSKKGIKFRHTDLCQISTDDHTLSYYEELKLDLAGPANIFLIRILNLIKPEAAKLLLIALCNLSKPGTKICFENFNHDGAGTTVYDTGAIVDYHAPYNMVASNFSPWPDFKMIFCRISLNGEHDPGDRLEGENSSTERFIFEKTDKCPYLDEEIEYQDNTKIISSMIGITFIPKKKPEFYVDATLDVKDESESKKEEICNKLKEFKIPHRICFFGQKEYLVVPNVNVRESVESYLPSMKNT